MKKFITTLILSLLIVALFSVSLCVYAEGEDANEAFAKYDFGRGESATSAVDAKELVDEIFSREEVIKTVEYHTEKENYIIRKDEYFISYYATSDFTKNLSGIKESPSVLSEILSSGVALYVPIFAENSEGKEIVVGDISITYNGLKKEYEHEFNDASADRYLSGEISHFIEQYYSRTRKRSEDGSGEFDYMIMVKYNEHRFPRMFICVSGDDISVIDFEYASHAYGEKRKELYTLDEFVNLRLEYENKEQNEPYIKIGDIKFPDLWGISRIYPRLQKLAVVLSILFASALVTITVLAVNISRTKKKLKQTKLTP